MKKSDAYVAIRNHVVDGEPLASSHDDIYKRWRQAFSLLSKYNVKGIAVEHLMNEFDISQAQAYRDVMQAEQIWGKIRKYSKDFLRTFLIESAMEDMCTYKEIAMRAIEIKKDEEGKEIKPSQFAWKIYSLNMNLREEARKSAIKAGGVDKDDIETPDFSQLQMPEIVINLQPEQLHVLQAIMKGGTVDLSTLTAGVKNEVFNDKKEKGFEEAVVVDKEEAD